MKGRCGESSSSTQTKKLNMAKFNTWIKVSESDSVPVLPWHKWRTDDVFLLKSKQGKGNLIEMDRKGTSSLRKQSHQKESGM